MMTVLKIKDNAVVNKTKFKKINNITSKIADKTLEQLENEGIFLFPETITNSNDMTKEQMVLKSVNNNYLSSNVMGFLGYDNYQLIIESRFSTEKEDYFFQYLVNRVLKYPNIINLNASTNWDVQLSNWTLLLFPHYLKSALQKGAFKKYVYNKYNNSNVKGVVDVARHIQKNTPFVGNIAYTQREFSYDNSLMELIRHTIEYIKKKPYGNQLLRNVKDEVEIVIAKTPNYEYHNRPKIIAENKKYLVRNAYYHEYRILQRLCIMILQHYKYQVGSNDNQIHGILFDGAWLWEEYLNSLIGDIFYHPMNKKRKGAQYLFSTEKGKTGLIYPDFISKNSNNRIIADAKYKPINNISNKDYLQVLAYMLRFDSKKGFYLYPEQDNQEKLTLMLNQGSRYEHNVESRRDICVIKCGLRIPSFSNSYEEFLSKIKLSEKVFLKNFVTS